MINKYNKLMKLSKIKKNIKNYYISLIYRVIRSILRITVLIWVRFVPERYLFNYLTIIYGNKKELLYFKGLKSHKERVDI